MQDHSTAPSKPAFKPRVRRLDAGRYLVESQSRPGTGHPVTVDHCPCKGFSYRGSCRHVALVQAIEPRMAAWYSQAAANASKVVSSVAAAALRLDPAVAAADAHLTRAYRALADAHEQSDERAVLLRQVDAAERAVAAADYAMMRRA